MAAEPTRIKLKRSTTATVVPTTSNLADGEVAVNIADRKIYVNNTGTIVEIANQKPNTGEVTTTMLATDITNGPGNTYYVASVGSDSNTLASGGANGKHLDTPFLTVAKALSVATSGDTINIAAGTYQETFPLTVPDGVTLRGANLRSTQITPTPATNDLNAFILQGDSHVSDLTVKDFFYNSGNDTGYGFVCASSLDSDRSPYVERVSVITKGSVTSASDPYGFSQGDAGRGAKLDGALFSSNSIEAAILFNEVTFIVPNSVGLLVTNGVRVEWLNSFVYFAAEGIKGVQGATGRAGAGQTRLKLAGVSGTFSAAEVIYQLEDNFQSGTYSRTATTVTITRNAHGLQNGDVVYADFTSGAGTDGFYTIANVTTNTFDLTDTASGTTSGNVTYKKADAYGTITTNDGTYLLINGKGVGEFTVGVPTGKVGVIAGDAQLDTAQKQFGTASLLLDGTTDHLSFPTDEDFGFGTTNWAAECFIRPASVTGTQYLLDFRDASASDTAPTLYLDGTTLNFGVGNTSQISGGTLATNTWYHVAVARFGGTTKLFLDGTELGTYSDSNDYGSTKPLGVGGEYAGTNEFAGHIDEIRVSKATARYTGAFTAPTAAFTTDLNTVLLLHFDGTDGSTTITDSGKGVRDIRSSGGDSATSLLTADYAQFGAELRSIASANVYGTKGAIADGAGVKLLLTSHNFAYIGSGADFTNDPDLAIPANEVTETNGGRIFYSATNEKGDFRIGDAFVVDQQTGNVQFQSTSTAQEAANITLTDATGTTRIFPAFVETGNLRLSGNTLSSTSGNVIVDPSANEDILLNAETIVPEYLYFDTNKLTSIASLTSGVGNLGVGTNPISQWSGYGLNSKANIYISNNEIQTLSIDNEGSEYSPGTVSISVVSAPVQAAVATAVLSTTGALKTVTLTNAGSKYTQLPDVSTSGGGGSGASFTPAFKSKGEVATVTVTNGGSGYTSPTVTFANAPGVPIDTGLDINAATDVITAFGHGFSDDDQVVYDNLGGSDNIGLTNGNTYYIVNSTSGTFQLSTSQGGSAVNLSTGTETHEVRGITATGTAVLSAGVIQSITITNSGSGYTTSPTITITDGTGVNATAACEVGFGLSSIAIVGGGSGFSSAPSLTISRSAGDTTGTGATATSTIGFTIASLNITNNGAGYAVAPTASISGGNATNDATIEFEVSKESGQVTSYNILDGGSGYTSTPTISIIGGKGSLASVDAEILPVGGNITTAGSGYAPGSYTSVAFTGGANSSDPGFVAATATFKILGFTGTISNAGSGYSDGTYTNISVVNVPTTTYTVTKVSRECLEFRYDATDDYEWNVVDNGSNTAYDFTRVSPTGTASGSNISITCEVGDVLTFNVTAAGHPFYIVSNLTAGAYDSQYNVPFVTGQGGTTVIFDTRSVDPGTYYYICSNHQAMQGTITVSAFSGTEYQVGQTITGGTSGASGVITSITDYILRFASVTNGPFSDNEPLSNGSVASTSAAFSAQQTSQVFVINGTEAAPITLQNYNSYNFDTSDSSLFGAPFLISSPISATGFSSITSGTAGTAGSFVQFVVTPSATTTKYRYTYGSYPQTGNYFTVNDGSGSQGSYGNGAVADLTVSGGSITAFELTNQGSNQKVGDVVTISAPDTLALSSGSGFQYTYSTNSTGISSVTDISTTGGTYVVGDVLSVNDSDVGSGGGGGFQFTVSKTGYLNSATVSTGGKTFDLTDTLQYINVPTTTGTPFELSIATLNVTNPVVFDNEGGLTTTNWTIDKDGAINNGGSTITSGDINSSGTLTVSGASTLSSTLNVTGNATFTTNVEVTGNLTVNGSSNLINNLTADLVDGTAASPSLKFENSTTTGIYRDGGDILGITAGGTARVKIGQTDLETTNNIKADSAFGAVTPFFLVDTTSETVDIGAPATGLRINNDASIESIGADANVDITFNPKGTGNLVLTGGTDKDFSITDGSTETFRVDTETGDTIISGKLDVNENIRVDDNIISNIGTNATTSFGQIITVSATGTGTGFTDNTYIGVTSTSNGSGTGATFDVTVSGGDITVIAVNAGGAGYIEGEEITLNPATVGAGTGKTITVTDIEGAGLVLKPQAGKNVKVDATSMFVVPAGDTNQRPAANDRQTGGIRFNTQQQQFEGYNGTDFVSLGGVRDVDQDTYILTEQSPSSDEDTFFFYGAGVEFLTLTNTIQTYGSTVTNIVHSGDIEYTTPGVLTLNGTGSTGNTVNLNVSGSTVASIRTNKDFELTNGLRLRAVPQQGVVTLLDNTTLTQTLGAYTPSQTFTAVLTSAQIEGTGLTVDVVTNGSGDVAAISVNSGGSNYEVGEVITISGTALGGTAVQPVTIEVDTISAATTEFTRLDILYPEYNLQLQSTPFIKYNGTGSEASWQINRGYNGGSESYLTVFDSTATFMELDDCRLEGGQLSSFGASSTIVQFDKTSFKGAKTLVTIESDDGKVHMLEVTSVCAASGTTAYATITNSVTSANDLVDADVVVVGNNVQVNLTKSTAATSSTSFTGRFTTTKVKV